MNIKEINIDNIRETDVLSQGLAKVLSKQNHQQILFLQGDLGVGKTTLVQHLLKHLGIHDRIKSPTYTLVEPYHLGDKNIYHIDLYRVQDLNELEHLGLQDLLKENALFLIEWPEKLKTFGIQPNLIIDLALFPNDHRSVKLSSKDPSWQDFLT